VVREVLAAQKNLNIAHKRHFILGSILMNAYKMFSTGHTLDIIAIFMKILRYEFRKKNTMIPYSYI